MADRTVETPVLIVGGGPVGLTLAGELGWRGTGAMLVERRDGPTEHPKATLLGARSMEYFRRWGVIDAIYDRALPPEINYFITFSTRLTGYELHRVTSPSIRETIDRPPEVMARYRELSWSPYYKTQIGQQALEPVLLDYVGKQDDVDLRHGHRFIAFEEDAEGVTSKIEEIATGEMITVRSKYLAACDGGTSAIRKSLGIRMNGRGRMRPNISYFFESDSFLDLHGRGVGNLYFIFAPDAFGVVTAIDGARRWNYQLYFLDPTRSTEDVDPDDALFAMMGKPFDYKLKGVQHWHHHQSVARAFRSRPDGDIAGRTGRVFLAGDAAHLFPPTGGVGMNTGIGDAVDLGWKLDAVLKGWGGDDLLRSYEHERKPIAVRNSTISANNSDKIDMVMDETPAEVEQAGPEGDAVRSEVARKIRWMARQFNSAGTHLGYRYVGSPVIVADGTPEPPDDPGQVVPSTWPGSRAPHAWLSRDTSVRGPSTLDWFGRDFVLVVASEADGTPIEDAFADLGVPLRIVAMPNVDIKALFEVSLVLVRPDGHVAWRGDRVMTDEARQIAHQVTGHA
ncbi:FAD-dependent oxidoreductase [Jannaschia sp. CCS1]|uniref:FAD-dependent oxidoreductase n=1 Tax=Jannaschia sp. (strain CCS1) TaxID=290400 RepID=UPI00006C00F3|nr:FAD-dependent oxidoreductase [Jannaschia sp. CCS1]ABD56686.1 monooxygenase FAD-binding protein [Jannaschia sp. CCS1]